eukprot:1161000-Pelagomonas_calceolata.AAC.1
MGWGESPQDPLMHAWMLAQAKLHQIYITNHAARQASTLVRGTQPSSFRLIVCLLAMLAGMGACIKPAFKASALLLAMPAGMGACIKPAFKTSRMLLAMPAGIDVRTREAGIQDVLTVAYHACRDVRTREAGIQDIHHKVRPDEVELIRRDYAANKGWETFLSYEDPRQDILIGLLRLRKAAGMAIHCCWHRQFPANCAILVLTPPGSQNFRADALLYVSCTSMEQLWPSTLETPASSSTKGECVRCAGVDGAHVVTSRYKIPRRGSHLWTPGQSLHCLSSRKEHFMCFRHSVQAQNTKNIADVCTAGPCAACLHARRTLHVANSVLTHGTLEMLLIFALPILALPVLMQGVLLVFLFELVCRLRVAVSCSANPFALPAFRQGTLHVLLVLCLHMEH